MPVPDEDLPRATDPRGVSGGVTGLDLDQNCWLSKATGETCLGGVPDEQRREMLITLGFVGLGVTAMMC